MAKKAYAPTKYNIIYHNIQRLRDAKLCKIFKTLIINFHNFQPAENSVSIL